MGRLSKIRCGNDINTAYDLMEKGAPIVCFDLETTGLSTIEDRILSFSATKHLLQNEAFVQIDQKDIFINPQRHIPEKASEVNHITDETVKDCPTEEEIIDEIIEFMGDSVVCGYNSKNYDGPMLSNTYLRTRGIEFTPKVHLDVLEMAREKLEAPRYNLETIANVMGVDGDIEFHNSLDDVKATFRVFKMLLKEYGDGKKKTEEKIVPLIPLRVKEAKYWAGYSHYQERIYVQTYPYSKTYYDIYRKEWRSDLDADLRLLERDLFAMYHCENIADLINAVK